MNTTTTNTPKQGTSIDDALGQTELGGWIAKNKNSVLLAIVLIFLGIVIYGVQDHFQTKKYDSYSDSLFKVVEAKVKPFEDDKISAEDLVLAFNQEWKKTGDFDGAGPFVIKVSDALVAKRKYEAAYQILSESVERLKNPTLNFFLTVRAAAVAEDLKKYEEAIVLLKKVLSNSGAYMQEKIYLDLGRLHLKKGEFEKAKAALNWVEENGKEAEFQKVSQLYLEEISDGEKVKSLPSETKEN